MATMIEKRAESIRKEIAKIEAKLEKHEAKLAKAVAKAEKMDALEYKEIWDEVDPNFPMYRKEEYRPYVRAYMDVHSEQREVEDLKRRLENAQKRFGKATGKVEEAKAQTAEDSRIARIESEWLTKTAEERRAEYEAWLKKFKAECLKDGIEIDEASATWISGTSANGKHFIMYLNRGWTERSRHCYTLNIDGETIFTSGDFTTAYKAIRK